mgnify:CR=1 FL=1
MEPIKITPFYIGQKIICVDDNNQYNNTCIINNKVVKDQEYIVRGFNFDGVLVFGITDNYYLWDKEEAGFNADRFKALEQLKFPLMKYSKVMEEQLISEN